MDFGSKNIGLAVGEVGMGVGSPRSSLQASGALRRDALALVDLANKEEAELIVVGLPVEENGSEGKAALICRRLGDEISGLGTKVAFVDESFTSIEAERELRELELSLARRKEHVHGLAAMLILERFALETKNP